MARKNSLKATMNLALISRWSSRSSHFRLSTPALDDLYYGERDVGAELNGQSITAVTRVPETLRVMISRSHPSEETLTWLEQLIGALWDDCSGKRTQTVLIAAGKADLYSELHQRMGYRRRSSCITISRVL